MKYLLPSLLIGAFGLWSAALYGQCNFSVMDTPTCGGTEVIFEVTDPTSPFNSYNWDFGDGESATGTTVSHFFPSETTNQAYVVTLSVENPVGMEICNQTAPVTVRATPIPSLNDLNFDPFSGLDPFTFCSSTTDNPELTIEFENTSEPLSDIVSYTIIWGDGTAPMNFTNANFPSSYTYNVRGAFDLILMATSSNGCTGTTIYQVFNGANPGLEGGTPGGTTGLCAPEILNFSIGGTQNNPPGTLYRVIINGEEVQQFVQQPGDEPLTSLPINFDTTSCGVTSQGGFANSFDVRLVASNACGQTAVTIEPIEMGSPPVAGIDPSENTICGGGSITFDNTTTEAAFINNGNCIEVVTLQWSISPATGWVLIDGELEDSETIEVQFDEPGSYTVSLTATNPCGTSTAVENITVSEPLDALVDISGNDLDCVSTVLVPNNTSTGAGIFYEWEISPITGWAFIGGTDANSAEPQIQFVQPNEYTITLNANNDCGMDSWDTTIVLAGLPMVSLPQPVQDDCESITLNFSTSNVSFGSNGGQMVSYMWSFPGGTPSSSMDQYPTGINYSPSSSEEFIYSVTITNECGTATAADTFLVQVPGSLSPPDDFEICSNEDPVTLMADPPNGMWSGPGVTSDGIFTPAPNLEGPNVLTYSLGQGLCETDTTMTVTVITAPSVSITSPNSACVSVASVPLETTQSGGTWTSTDGGIITGNNFNPSASGEGTFTLIYTYTDPGNSCVGEATQMFTVQPLPEITTEDVTFCNVDEALDLPTPNPLGGSWSGSGLVDMDAGTFNPLLAGGVGDYEIIYTYTDNNSCTNTDTFTVFVIEPDMVDAGPDTSFCVSVTAYDLSVGASPGMGQWSINAGAGVSGNTLDPSALDPGTYDLTYRVGEGSCLVEDMLEVEIFGLPAIDLNGNIAGACISEEEVTLLAAPLNGSWSVDNGGVLVDDTFFPNSSGVGNYNLVYTFTDDNQCTGEDSFPFEVYSLPAITVNDTTYCNTPGTVELPATNPTGGNWEGPGILGTTFNPIIAGGVGTYDAQYTYTDGNGCVDSMSIMITVDDPVFVEAGIGDTLCNNDPSFQLMGFEPASGGNWTGPGITDPMGIFDPGEANTGLNTLIYTVGSGNCQVFDSIQILVIDLTATTAGDDEEACLMDAPFTLSGNDPLNGVWSGPGIVNAATGLFDPQMAGEGSHTITYTYIDNLSDCDANATKLVVVHPMPASAFSLPVEACLGQDILFTNESASTFNPNWNFGDMNMSTDISPTHMYTDTGTYTITLVTINEFGCTDMAADTLFITEPPTAEFGLDQEEGCAILPINFENLSVGYDMSYSWNFGNGEVSDQQNPSTIFYEQGTTDTTYIISLEVTNLCATRSYEDTITVFPLPLANFGVSIDSSCTPMEVTFGNVTLGNPESFFWDFDNGAFSTDTMPGMQVYYTDTSTTVYTITLIAENFCGRDTATQSIVVSPVEVEAFFNIPANVGCEPYTVPFTSFNTPGTFVNWDFGDGNTSSQTNPSHTFEDPGDYEVIQYVSNGCGYDSITAQITVLPAPEVGFDFEHRVCQGTEVDFENQSVNTSGNFWYFGDGDTSVLNNPIHTYDTSGTFTVTLIGISAENGCPASVDSQITILPLPMASFDPSAIDGCAPLTVNFENTSTNAAFYNWDFGDMNTSTLASPIHTFDTAAAYTVRLLVTDMNGCQDDTIFFSITAHPNPVAGFELTRSQTCGVPLDVSFTNTSEGATGYSWTFGDGGESMLNNPIHTYLDTGVYNIELIASNEFMCTNTATAVIRGYPVPTASFSLDPNLGCVPDSISFFNNSTFANQFFWSFGDRNTSTEVNPIHTYYSEGIFSVTLVAAYDSICYDSITLINAVEMLPSPFANFEYEEAQGGAAGILNFFNRSENAISYTWDFGDGSISNEVDPQHRYFENGVWQVMLEAIGANGCADDTLLTITPTFFKGLWIPTGLSPENGLGDVRLFKPAGAGLKEYHVQIFSQHGELIWESQLLDDGRPAEAWDGRLNGVVVPQDVYVWKAYGVFEDGTVWKGMPLKSGKFKTSGTLVVLR